jgi:hypothetical protein
LLSAALALSAPAEPCFVFSTDAADDLCPVAPTSTGVSYPRFDKPTDAVQAALGRALRHDSGWHVGQT